MRRTVRSLVLCLALIGSLSVLAVVPDWVAAGARTSSLPSCDTADASLLYGRTVISSEGQDIVFEYRRVFRILTADGLVHGRLVVAYDDDSRLTRVAGWRLDGNGRLLEELEKDDIERVAMNLSFVDDSRQLIGRFDNVEKGDIVAFAYRLKFKTLFRDVFLSLGGSYEVVRHEVIVNGNARTAVLNDPSGYVTESTNGFEVKGIPVLKRESSQPPLADRVPQLAVSYHPEGESWESFGRYYWNLTNSQLALTGAATSKAAAAVPFKDRRQYIQDVIRFVSGNINYVDIELGVGGYIPHSCTTVLDKRYGDCKDMAFLAAAMLRAQGIDAYPVLAQGRSHGRIYPEFPGNQFNHVILGVRLEEEERDLSNVELEGQPYLFSDLTSRITRPPFLPDQLEGSYALMARESGGVLVRLPWSSADVNRRDVNIRAGLRIDGSISATLTETLAGQCLREGSADRTINP